LKTACNVMNAMYKGVSRWEGGGKGGWVNNALRHRQSSCVHSGPDRWPQLALTIPQTMQTYNGTELDPKLPY